MEVEVSGVSGSAADTSPTLEVPTEVVEEAKGAEMEVEVKGDSTPPPGEAHWEQTNCVLGIKLMVYI